VAIRNNFYNFAFTFTVQCSTCHYLKGVCKLRTPTWSASSAWHLPWICLVSVILHCRIVRQFCFGFACSELYGQCVYENRQVAERAWHFTVNAWHLCVYVMYWLLSKTIFLFAVVLDITVYSRKTEFLTQYCGSLSVIRILIFENYLHNYYNSSTSIFNKYWKCILN
jgi:hypothetical protein